MERLEGFPRHSRYCGRKGDYAARGVEGWRHECHHRSLWRHGKERLRRVPREIPRGDQEIRGALAALLLLLASSTAAIAADSEAVARGAYLAAAAGCDQCHTDATNGGPPYAGGRAMATELGPNITPDRASGIGGWSLADFARAMRWGIAPDGTHYTTAFPFPYFARLTDGDL